MAKVKSLQAATLAYVRSCRCIFQPESIAESGGVITITLESEVLSFLCKNEIFGVSLSESIPNTSRCNRIVVTDGTTDLIVAKNNQYYRPEKLPCECDMILCNKKDPDLAVFCRYATPRGCI